MIQRLAATAFRWSIASLIAGVVGASLFSGEASAKPQPAPSKPAEAQEFRALHVEVIGQGRPILMIPGLNSGADTWRDTCAALQADRVQCHLVHLPGFAGRPAAVDRQGDFLADMRDRLLAYVEERKLERPVVMGHSLGGVLALQMAIKSPESIDRLIVVDSLPFYPALQNAALTSDQARPMADAMRRGMLTQDAAAFEKNTFAAVQNMAHDKAQVATLVNWGVTSDRATTADAMHAMMVTDLRAPLAGVRTPTLVLGSWAAYAPFGATKQSTAGIFQAQFAALPGVRIEMSEGGYHFLMWDDAAWLQTQVRGFLRTPGN